MENTQIEVNKDSLIVVACDTVDASQYTTDEEYKAACKDAVNASIRESIVGSFKGHIATNELFNHFSTITSIDETLNDFALWCYQHQGWLKKCDVGSGTSEKLSGWKSLRRYAAKLLLTESGQWVEELTEKQLTDKVLALWNSSQNTRAKKLFRNATVYNNLASFKSTYLAKKRQAVIDEADKDAEKVASPEVFENSGSGDTEVKEPHRSIENLLGDVQQILSGAKDNKKLTKNNLLEIIEDCHATIEAILKG